VQFLLVLLLIIASGSPVRAGDPVLEQAIKAHQSGDLAAAEVGYRDFLKRYPKIFEVRSNLGAVLAAQGRYLDAITEYKSIRIC